MKDKKSIVILYSEGLYDTSAMELKKAIERVGAGSCHVVAVPDDKYCNLGSAKVSRAMYKFSVRNARWMYLAYSQMTVKRKASKKALKNIKPDPSERTGFNKFWYNMTYVFAKVKNILRRYEPDIVLCFTPSVLKSSIKASEQLKLYTTKIYGCIADFSLDLRFFNRRASGYIVENDSVKKSLIDLGVENDKIFVSPFIVSRNVHYDKEEVKKQIGILNDKPCLLIMGGRYGSSMVKNALSYLVDYTDNFNLIVMTGGSATIVNVARQLVRDNDDSVFLINSIDDIAKLYNLADIVVATPTTCVCGEALTYAKPLVLLKGTGHVETDNAKYLLSHGYALDGSKKDRLITALSDIMLGGTVDYMSISDFPCAVSLDGLATDLLDKAGTVFEERKILLAEESLDRTEVTEEYIIEEIDTDVVPAIETNGVIEPDVESDIVDVDTDSIEQTGDIDTDGAIIDEYNDIEEV